MNHLSIPSYHPGAGQVNPQRYLRRNRMQHSTLCARWFSTLTMLFVLTCCCAPRLLKAQENSASLNGVVRDPSGAVISGASMKLTNLNTNIAQTKQSNADGLYSFVNI